MSTQLAVLYHVLEVLQFPLGVINAIKDDASVGSVGLLTNIDGDQFLKLEGVKHSHIKSLDLFKMWFQEYVEVNGGAPVDWELEFTKDVWEEFMIMQGLSKNAAKHASVPSAPVPYQVTSSTGVVPIATLPQVKIGDEKTNRLGQQNDNFLGNESEIHMSGITYESWLIDSYSLRMLDVPVLEES